MSDPYPPKGSELYVRAKLRRGELAPDLRKLIVVISSALGLSIVKPSLYHRFRNGGATAIAILKESHIALEWWPEGELRGWLVTCTDLPEADVKTVDILLCKVFGFNRASTQFSWRDW